MSKKPAATLSASLVAIKGAAAPAPDMSSRGGPVAPAQLAAATADEASRTAQSAPAREGVGALAAEFPGASQFPARVQDLCCLPRYEAE